MTFGITIDGQSIKLAGLDRNPALCLTSQIGGHSRKLDALIAIAKLTHIELDIKALNKLADDANRLSKLRNRIVHDPWHATLDGTKKRLEIASAKTFSFGSKPTNLSELRDIYEQVCDARERLLGILKRAKRAEAK